MTALHYYLNLLWNDFMIIFINVAQWNISSQRQTIGRIAIFCFVFYAIEQNWLWIFLVGMKQMWHILLKMRFFKSMQNKTYSYLFDKSWATFINFDHFYTRLLSYILERLRLLIFIIFFRGYICCPCVQIYMILF